MAEAKVLWFVVLDADDERVKDTTELDVALRARREAGPGARIVQENRASGERQLPARSARAAA